MEPKPKSEAKLPPELVEQTTAIEPFHLQCVQDAVNLEQQADIRVARAEQALAAARHLLSEAKGERQGLVKFVGKLYGMVPPLDVQFGAKTIKGMREKPKHDGMPVKAGEVASPAPISAPSAPPELKLVVPEVPASDEPEPPPPGAKP